MKHAIVALCVVVGSLLSQPLSAQTLIAPGTTLVAGDKIAADLPDNVSLTDGPTWTYRIKDNGVPVTEVTNPTCQASTTIGIPGTCLFPLSQANVDALNMAGVHSLTLTMVKTGVGESTPSLPLSWPAKAGALRNLRLTK